MESKTYKAAILESFGSIPKYGDREFRPLEKDEVLIKVKTVALNPSDFFFISGTYGIHKPTKFPIVPGFEGSGEIVSVGSDIDQKLIGLRGSIVHPPKKEDVTYDGTWAEYFYGKLNQDFIIYGDKIDFDKIAYAFINPMTVLGFIDTLKKKGETSVAQSGASSALGKMFAKIAEKEGIKIINIIRKKENLKFFEELGSNHVISIEDSDWESQLKKLSNELNVKSLFDCVGGEYTGKFLSALPHGSTVYHYGNLQLNEPTGFSTKDFIFEEKTLKGWWLASWIRDEGPEKLGKALGEVKEDLLSENSIFGTEIGKSFSLENVQDAYKFYIENRSYSGKIVLKP